MNYRGFLAATSLGAIMSQKFKPTEMHRRCVKVLVRHGYSQQDVAEYLEIDAKTLRQHFRRELTNGSDFQEADELVALALSAERGNVSAARELNRRMKEKNSTDVVETGRTAQQIAKDMNAKYAHIGTSWADILPKDTFDMPSASEARRPIKTPTKRRSTQCR